MDSGSTPGGQTGTLSGNWKFIAMNSKTEAIIESSDGVDIFKSITNMEYNTRQNTGTMQIDATKMISVDMGYSVDTVATGFLYHNNVFMDTISAQFSFVMPPTSSVSDYTRVTSDSLYFTNGQFVVGGGTGTNQAKPTGVKIKFEGDKLFMTFNLSESTTQNTSGIRQSDIKRIKSVITFQRL